MIWNSMAGGKLGNENLYTFPSIFEKR